MADWLYTEEGSWGTIAGWGGYAIKIRIAYYVTPNPSEGTSTITAKIQFRNPNRDSYSPSAANYFTGASGNTSNNGTFVLNGQTLLTANAYTAHCAVNLGGSKNWQDLSHSTVNLTISHIEAKTISATVTGTLFYNGTDKGYSTGA
jgi:hypothetical protein